MSARTSLENPGDCSICSRPRTSTLVVDIAGKTHSAVFCPSHCLHPSTTKAGVVFAIDLLPDKTFTIWSRPETAIDSTCHEAIRRAMQTMSRVRDQRIADDDRLAAGPWRVIIEGDQIIAPRSPRSTKTDPWPLVRSRLRKSKWRRLCVQCSAVLEEVDVYRPATDAAVGRKNQWRDSAALSSCIVCVPCVEAARKANDQASAVASSILGDLLARRE